MPDIGKDLQLAYEDGFHDGYNQALSELNSHELKTVVRCKDCIYCVKEPNGELYCDILAVGYEPLGSKKVNEDWFCGDGKRKEEGEQNA